jgi:hypothetical protein
MTTHTARTGLRRFFGVATDPQTYRNLTYLALSFPLGVLYFTLVWGGGAVGVSALPIVVGAPILLGVLAMAVSVADVEARLARGLLGADVAMDVPRPSEETLSAYAKRLVLSPRSYLAVVYLLSKFVIGVVAVAALTVAATLSATLAAAPLLYDLQSVTYQAGPTVLIDTLPEAAVASVAGVLLAFVSLHAFNLAARALARYTELLLGTDGVAR